jgi:hypothetical protein
MNIDAHWIAAFVLFFSVALLLPSLWRMRNGPNTNPLHRRKNWRD